MNAKPERDPQPKTYTRDIEMDGQTVVAHLKKFAKGCVLVQIQMPDSSIHPGYDIVFDDEACALLAAVRRANGISALDKLEEMPV